MAGSGKRAGAAKTQNASAVVGSKPAGRADSVTLAPAIHEGKLSTYNKRREMEVTRSGVAGPNEWMKAKLVIRETAPKSGLYYVEYKYNPGAGSVKGGSAVTTIGATGMTLKAAKAYAREQLAKAQSVHYTGRITGRAS